MVPSKLMSPGMGLEPNNVTLTLTMNMGRRWKADFRREKREKPHQVGLILASTLAM